MGGDTTLRRGCLASWLMVLVSVLGRKVVGQEQGRKEGRRVGKKEGRREGGWEGRREDRLEGR